MRLSKVSSQTKVRHENAINKGLSRLPISARRVLFLVLAQINSMKMIKPGAKYRVYAHEYAKICGIGLSSSYQQLKKAAKILQQQTIEIPREQVLTPFYRPNEVLEVSKGKGPDIINITDRGTYEEGEGFVDIVFSRSMEPYISYLTHKNGGRERPIKYTTQVLLSAAKIKDSNASKVYQLIRENISLGKPKYFDIGVNQLKEEIGLFTEARDGEITWAYPIFKEFNRTVLKKCIQTINLVTELEVNYEIIERKQRKATKLRFTYSIDEQMKFEGF